MMSTPLQALGMVLQYGDEHKKEECVRHVFKGLLPNVLMTFEGTHAVCDLHDLGSIEEVNVEREGCIKPLCPQNQDPCLPLLFYFIFLR